MIICNRCGRALATHRDPNVSALCRGAVKANPAEVKFNQQKALSRLKIHTPDRPKNPRRPHAPRVTH